MAQLYQLLFIIVGGGALAYGVYRFHKLATQQKRITASKSWPVVPGKVSESQLRYPPAGGRRRPNPQAVNAQPSGENAERESFWAEISYTYQVNGSSYAGKALIEPFSLMGSDKPAVRIVERFPRGKKVQVHYQPDQPENAVADFEQISTADLAIAVFSVFGGICLIIYYLIKFAGVRIGGG